MNSKGIFLISLCFLALITVTLGTTAVFKQQGLHDKTCGELAAEYDWSCPANEVQLGKSAWSCRAFCKDAESRPCYEMEERRCYCCYP